jgi:peptide/nickel transport system permease protein
LPGADIPKTEATSPPGGQSERSQRGLWLGVAVLALLVLAALFADFLSPNDYRSQSRSEPGAPPTPLRFTAPDGSRRLWPVIYRQRLIDPLDRRYYEDAGKAYDLELFARGFRYKLLGLFETDRHLLGVRGEGDDVPRLYLLGTDELGRDRFARLLTAARFSLIVGPTGTLFAALLGIVLGCVAGYTWRPLSELIMRSADAMMALPVLVIVLATRAAFPLELPPLRAGLLMVIIFVAVGWAEMARLTRGLVLSLREREFAEAAKAIGASPARILFNHILRNAYRPLLVQVTLMLPAFLLAETALSFLGVGVQEPQPSWGSMLAAASDLQRLQREPLVLLSPAIGIFLFVFGVRLVGDAVREDGH